MAAFSSLFEPRNVAVIGVSENPRSTGFVVLKNILHGGLYAEYPDGFLGEVYAVGAAQSPILGAHPLADIAALPDQVDLAVLCDDAAKVPEQLEQLAAREVPVAVVLAAADADAAQRIGQTAAEHGIRVLGPGTHGVIANTRQLNASLCPMRPYAGRIALLASHGSVMNSFLQHSHDENVGFSFYLSCGQTADINDIELLKALADHPMANCVAWSFGQAGETPAVVEAAQAVLAKKPLVYLRAGRAEGAELDSALQGLGAFATQNLAEFVDAARALSTMPSAASNKIHFVTNGGPLDLACDTAREMGLEVCGSTDLGAMATREEFRAALARADEDPQAAGVCVILSFQPGSPPLPIAEVIADWAEGCLKPVTASCVGLAGQPCEDHLDIRGVPEYEFPHRALFGMKALVHRGSYAPAAVSSEE